MKIFKVGAVFVIAMFLSFPAYCASPSGMYVNSQDASEFIDLSENNTFTVFESKIHAGGTYVYRK